MPADMPADKEGPRTVLGYISHIILKNDYLFTTWPLGVDVFPFSHSFLSFFANTWRYPHQPLASSMRAEKLLQTHANILIAYS